jgi:hypothetical protein
MASVKKKLVERFKTAKISPCIQKLQKITVDDERNPKIAPATKKPIEWPKTMRISPGTQKL